MGLYVYHNVVLSLDVPGFQGEISTFIGYGGYTTTWTESKYHIKS